MLSIVENACMAGRVKVECTSVRVLREEGVADVHRVSMSLGERCVMMSVSSCVGVVSH